MSTTLNITGKNILVTGGGGGIGRGIVHALHPTNKVYVVERDEARLRELAQECPGIVPICLDLCDWDTVRTTLDKILPPVVHGVVNNAGIGIANTVMNCKEEEFDKVVGVNLRAIVCVSQVVAERLIKYNESKPEDDKVMASIVNISSLASRFPTRVSVAYNVSKAGVDMITKCMALELGPQNIRVNSVNPGIVMGTDLSAAWIGEKGEQLKAALLSRTPIGKVVRVQDIVNAVLFMLCDESVCMIHGESLFVDGGYSVA